jgi:hypothetical protein
MPDFNNGPGLPLLVVVEGENDISFLKSISAMLRHESPQLPNLSNDRRILFLPTGGGNLKDWVVRISSLHKLAFFLFDREQEPETSLRRQALETARVLPGCVAAITSKRAIENYLHPAAIQEACGIDLAFDDETKVSEALALQLMMKTGCGSSWHALPCKRQRRLHEKAKKILNLRAVQFMTPALLAQQDPAGEIIGWLQTIRQMIEAGS